MKNAEKWKVAKAVKVLERGTWLYKPKNIVIGKKIAKNEKEKNKFCC